MQTILGANGIIGEELAKELFINYTKDIRIVGRNPMKVNDTDQLFKADLLDPEKTKQAVEGSDVVYLTVGLPYSSEVFLQNWPIILKNTIAACALHKAKLVYFDNTYMYDQSKKNQSEESPFEPSGKKGVGKEIAAKLLLEAMQNKVVTAAICRAPEFYGPGKTKGITNALIFENIKQNKKLKVLLRDDKKRTLIYTPDASRAVALIGNTEDTFGQTWHLPCDDNRLTYREFIKVTSDLYGKQLEYSIVPKWLIKLISIVNPFMKETQELLPRYETDNIFSSAKFKERFPEFKLTTYQEGIATILSEIKAGDAPSSKLR